MHHINLLTRRSFLTQSAKTSLAVALSTLVDIPLVVKRALAEGNIGLNGKKLLFIFLRGANDGLNTCVPIGDYAYTDIDPSTGQNRIRPEITIPKDLLTDYSVKGPCDVPLSARPGDPTFQYANAIRLGNGFAALHPALKFLTPVYNAGDLAVIHRVGYPQQSRSHFDAQVDWEVGNPNHYSKDGIFYRTIVESGLASSSPLTGVSIQSSLPMLLRGSAAAMTNLTDPTRYSLLGIPNGAGNNKAERAILNATSLPFPEKKNRNFLRLQYENLTNTLAIFHSIDFSEAGNTFLDNANTDNDYPYHLFPTSNAKNGGWIRTSNPQTVDPAKYVVPTGSYDFFNDLKAAALILNKTDAIIAGTELGGFDTHNTQGGVTGDHANLQRIIGWAIYGLRKYFTAYADKAAWDNLVVITLSEFGRTTVQNSDEGTDHAEAGAMFVAGGAVKGYGKGNPSGVFGCSLEDPVPWKPGPAGSSGSMFGVSSRYLKRAIDYRSVLGELIRDHLGSTQAQLDRIIPGYADEAAEHLQHGGTVGVPVDTRTTPIMGELGIV